MPSYQYERDDWVLSIRGGRFYRTTCTTSAGLRAHPCALLRLQRTSQNRAVTASMVLLASERAIGQRSRLTSE